MSSDLTPKTSQYLTAVAVNLPAKITSTEEADRWGEDLDMWAKAKAKLENDKKEMLKGARDTISKVTKAFQPSLDACDSAIRARKALILEYRQSLSKLEDLEISTTSVVKRRSLEIEDFQLLAGYLLSVGVGIEIDDKAVLAYMKDKGFDSIPGAKVKIEETLSRKAKRPEESDSNIFKL
jgi:hypothetical protein